ncbi:MAG TPA: hypothetical protein VF590_18315, partial [Isosphaeraceae bacterium]
LRPQFDGRAGTRPLPAGRWTRVAGYHDGQAQRWCREPLAVSVWLRPGDPAYPYPISLEWSAPETPQPRWLGAIWEVAQFLWGGILWIVKRMKGLT